MEDWPVSNSNVYQISLKTSNCRSDALITYSKPKKKAKSLFCSICNDLINDIYLINPRSCVTLWSAASKLIWTEQF